jgi:hypothetical protein
VVVLHVAGGAVVVVVASAAAVGASAAGRWACRGGPVSPGLFFVL